MALAPLGYRDLELIGAGATSRVFRAVEVKTGEVVALKRLNRQLVKNGDALARLRRELDALGQLRHEAIARMRDVIRWQGDPTIVLDFVPGEDLKEHVRAHGPLAPDVAERVLRTLLDVARAAHAAGIVHRDIKPQNVRLAPGGEVYLLDFGSARLDASSELTATGTTVGTPEYMAPELFAGSVYDPRVDLYGIGATVFDALTGHPPSTADSLAELAYVRTTRDAPPVKSVRADVPFHLAQVIDRCLARAPEDRHASAHLAAWALEHPEEERAFQARRAAHPPCLACDAPIPPESTVCPVCRRERPFSFSPGHARLEVTSVAEPARFVEAIASRVPELAHPRSLARLARRAAALSFRRQRLLANVDRADAEAFAAKLEREGVRTEVKNGVSPWLVAALPMIILGYVALQIARALHPEYAELVPYHTSAWTLLLGNLEELAAPLFAGALAMAVIVGQALAAITSRGLLSLSPARRSPEPSFWRRFLVSPFRRDRQPRSALSATERRITSAFAMTLALAVVPLELSALEMLPGVAWPSAARIVNGRPTDPREATRMEALPSPDPYVASARTYEERRARETLRNIDGVRDGFAARALVLEISLAALALALGVWLVRRARVLDRESARILGELDRRIIQRVRQKSLPRSRAAGPSRRLSERTLADQLSQRTVDDEFAARAARRAVDLARCLPEPRARPLADALATLGRGDARRRAVMGGTHPSPSPRSPSDDSLLARCILETDAEQLLRFRFLQLEGELEAEAATAWAAQLRERRALMHDDDEGEP